ncbi:MAG: RNA 2',3'-cyclic phosphodiesterase [Bacteroidia bacterium]|nr:RNA 2',3'-cyclic phosphodiesterase [Bacteroidia bacterium]
MTLKKYFIAIVIPEPIFSEIEAIKQHLRVAHGLKGALRSPAHITLHRPFEWKEEKENVLIEKLSRFSFENPFEIELKNFDFFEPRVVYVNVQANENLGALHQALKSFAVKELRLFNESNDMRGFHPHITIANRDLKKPKFYELQKEFAEKFFSGSFKCTTFSLLKLDKVWHEQQLFNLS